MPGPSNTLLIEGSFDELSEEFAHYVEELQKKQKPDVPSLSAEIAPLLEKGQKDEVLKKLVTASSILNAAPEKGCFDFVQKIKEKRLTIHRIHGSLQPPHPSDPTVPQSGHLPP